MAKARNQPRDKSRTARLDVSLINHCRGLRIDRDLLVKAVKLTAREHSVSTGQVELAIFDDKDMARLHQEYLGRRKVTDVICFDLTPPAKAPGLRAGGLWVSLALGGQVARRQAKQNRTSINKELALYTIHGLLHLLGYDDARPADAQRMHSQEDELLVKLGVGVVFYKAKP